MKRVVVAVLASAIALLLAGCGSVVPDSTGLPVDQATSMLKAAGFEMGELVYDGRSSDATWTVRSQKPEPGERAKRGTVVSLTIAGPPPVGTPDLTTLDEGAATEALASVGLSPGEISQDYSDSVSRGELISQTPAPGTEVPKGGFVTLVFSKGPQPIAVPLVQGKSESVATKALESAGFQVKVTKEYGSAAKGVVVSQKPAEGKAQPGAAVRIVVSQGPSREQMKASLVNFILREARRISPTQDFGGGVDFVRLEKDNEGVWYGKGMALPKSGGDGPTVFGKYSDRRWVFLAVGSADVTGENPHLFPKEIRDLVGF